MKVAIVDYGLGNIRSVVNALECFEVDVVVASTGAELEGAARIVLPGVGSFDAGMRGLRERGHDAALDRLVREQSVPYLGICLGLQFMFSGSEEGSEPGLGWFDAKVRRFPDRSGAPKVPHIGWNDVRPVGNAALFRNLVPPFDFYFVHSYYVPNEGDAARHACGLCNYDIDFVAALERDTVAGVQFHPEKSQLAGMKMLETFLFNR
jgi:glutamine amidotransferase